MSLTLKGRIWKDGNFWRAEIRDFGILVKGKDFDLVIDALSGKLREIAPDLTYELSNTGVHDGPLIFETDDVVDAALLIIKRRLKGR